MTNTDGRARMLAWLPRGALLATAVLAPLTGCEDDGSSPELRSGTYYGQAVPVGNGTARTYLVLADGAPTELGVALSETSLDGLPAPSGHAGGGAHAMFDEYLLPLPAEAAATPYRLVELDWNPAGHEPPGIYDQPHFDFHFYTITEAERNAIDPADPQFDAKAARYPAAEFTPRGFVSPAPAGIPRMGVHWVDPTSPELNGSTFTNTFIYGTWDGKLIFTEPMITRAFLLSRPDLRKAIGTAERYAPAGAYPDEYRVYWEAGAREYRVALSGLETRG